MAGASLYMSLNVKISGCGCSLAGFGALSLSSAAIFFAQCSLFSVSALAAKALPRLYGIAAGWLYRNN